MVLLQNDRHRHQTVLMATPCAWASWQSDNIALHGTHVSMGAGDPPTVIVEGTGAHPLVPTALPALPPRAPAGRRR
jgi:hypothetical protein